MARALLVATLLTLAACTFAEKPPGDRVHPDMAKVSVTLAGIAGAEVAPDARTRTALLMEAIGDLSAEPSLEALVLAGDMVANRSAAHVTDALAEIQSALGILAAPKVYALGARETTGAAPREEVVRALEGAKLLPARTGTYSTAPRPGVRVIALDPPAPDAADALARELSSAKEDLIVVAAAAVPPEGPLRDLLARDRRVKVLLAGGPPSPPDLDDLVVINVPSLAREGQFLVVTIEGDRLVARWRAPARRDPERETTRRLRSALPTGGGVGTNGRP